MNQQLASLWFDEAREEYGAEWINNLPIHSFMKQGRAWR
jgi:hypothetical protein